MEQRISHFLQKYVTEVYFPNIRITDIVEVLILTFLIYQLMIWVKNTKAWMLMKGILVLAVFILVAAIFQMHTILFLAKNAVTVMATAAVVVFQPELRRALEKLGEKSVLSSLSSFFFGWFCSFLIFSISMTVVSSVNRSITLVSSSIS